MNMGHQGRSGNSLEFKVDRVVKHVPLHELWQPLFMRRHHGVFVNVTYVAFDSLGVEYGMPRLTSPSFNETSLALEIVDKISYLWSHYARVPLDWRNELLEHLVPTVEAELSWSREKLTRLVERLPDVKNPATIHGDPTFSNSLRYPNGSIAMIDPLMRSFIPPDRHVDVGKVFQSLWGYERILDGKLDYPSFDEEAATQIIQRHDLDGDACMAWCIVHFIRLLPYQMEREAAIFKQFLEDARF